MQRAAAGAAAVMLALLCGCASQSTTVVLLPEPDGRATAVGVGDAQGEIVLDRPYAAVQRTRSGTRTYVATPAEVQAMFGATLDALPLEEAKFTVHFDEGKDTMSDASRELLAKVIAEVTRRPVPDVAVIGHTDRVGTDAVNDALARQRAEAVRTELVRQGVPEQAVQASSRGSREPVVPTPAGVAEPRNRRVDIIVR